MKKIIFFILYIFLSLPVFSPIYAQEKLLLALTQYETAEQKNALFDHSTRVLNYFEGESVEKPTFLSLITEKQQQSLIPYGVVPKILDYDTDLSRYVLLSSPHPQYRIQTNELSKLGEVIMLSKYHALIKLPEGETYTPVGEATRLVRVPFPEKYVKPDISIKPISPTPIILSPTIKKPTAVFLLFLLVVSFLISFLLTFIILKKRPMADRFKKLAIFVVIAGLIFAVGFFVVPQGIIDNRDKNDLELKSTEEF